VRLEARSVGLPRIPVIARPPAALHANPGRGIGALLGMYPGSLHTSR
jgi:hypothetical protein